MTQDKASNIIDFSFLDHIEPVREFPPTQFQLLTKIETAFHVRCIKFLESQRKFYNCSKKIQKKLVDSVEGTHLIHQKFQATFQSVQKLSKTLKKLNGMETSSELKIKFLSCLCEIIKMENHREILLTSHIENEEKFLTALQELNSAVDELQSWNSSSKLILQLKQELGQLLEEVIKRFIKDKLSDSLIKKIVGPYSKPLLRDQNISNIFKNNLKNNRLNYFRIGLNPLINNINYAQNISELYEMIVEEWIKMINQQLIVFHAQNVPAQLKSIPQQVLGIFVQQIIPKLERNIYKIKQLTEVAKIRSYLFSLRKKLQEISESDWDPLPKLLVKTHILLQQKLDHEGEQLEIAKYNIYSLVSYIPIREHLERVKICTTFDTKDISEVQVQWEKAFMKLVNSREPFKQPKNKSIIIFNLNIWYMYQKIIKDGKGAEKCSKTINWCQQNFIDLNINEIKKKYSGFSFQNLLDICSDMLSFKRLLFAEVTLLGHDHLRKSIEQKLKQEFINRVYTEMLKKNNIQTSGMNYEQILPLADSKKINLNKYGKMSEILKIFSITEMRRQLKQF